MNLNLGVPTEEEAELWQGFVEQRTPALREQLFRLHVSYAKAIAARLYGARPRDDVEFIDYYQLACVGLLESIERYRPLGEASFRTYCTRRIEGNILDGIERATEAQQQIALRRRIRKERLDSLRKAPGVTQTPLELLTEVAVGLAIGVMLDETGMYLASPEATGAAPSPYDTLAWSQSKARLLEFVCLLPEQQRKVVEYHYLQGLRFEQVAQLLALTKGRIAQIHSEALRMLREVALTAGTMQLTS